MVDTTCKQAENILVWGWGIILATKELTIHHVAYIAADSDDVVLVPVVIRMMFSYPVSSLLNTIF